MAASFVSAARGRRAKKTPLEAGLVACLCVEECLLVIVVLAARYPRMPSRHSWNRALVSVIPMVLLPSRRMSRWWVDTKQHPCQVRRGAGRYDILSAAAHEV